jgi:hypothetical protein
MKTAVRVSESEWQTRIAAWRASGQTAAAFAQAHGYAVGTLRWWSSRLRRRAAARFVRLVPRAAVTASPEVVLEVGGARVRVARGFDAALLAQVVAALRTAAR